MVFNLRTFSFAESVEDDPTPPKSFSLKELRVATDKFSTNNFVGGGIFKVYRGRLADGSLVAVKRALRDDQRKEEMFEAEMTVGSTVSTHPNVLRLRGFCRTKKELLLVYPFMIDTLLYHLRKGLLDWTTRKRIALGVARGLAHLHNQGNINIMRCNIQASEILLNVHFEAVIGGFSNAIIMHEGNVEEGTDEWFMWSADSGSHHHRYEYVYVETPVRGGRWLIAPEFYVTGECTLKNDVYAYGRMLLELISGQPIWILSKLAGDGNPNLDKWIGDFLSKNELERVIDPNLQGNYVEEEVEQLVRLALSCSRWAASARPEMSEVVRMLESQCLRGDPSSGSSWSQDSTPYYSFPPSPSPQGIAP
ncbi:Protein kinase domain-containing protein [Psidium guajava]|nr:Protein kinase domain-containing protein [Psidium guajava]